MDYYAFMSYISTSFLNKHFADGVYHSYKLAMIEFNIPNVKYC